MRLMTYLIAALLFASGSAYGEQKANKSLSSKTISGQIFVVTNGQNAIKLPLVTVFAIPNNELFTSHMRAKYQTAQEQKQIKLQDLEHWRDGANKKVDECRDHINTSPDAYKKIWVKTCDDMAQTFAFASNSQTANINNIAQNGDPYMIDMPTPISSTKTDADGKFTLRLPAGKYALGARSSRQVFENYENYNWLIFVDISSTNKSLTLSNDNLFETGCDECVQPEKFKRMY